MTDQINLGIVWAASGGVDPVTPTKYSTGWVAEIPTYQNFNYMVQGLDQNMLSLAEKGRFAWQDDITYTEHGTVLGSNGTVYYAKDQAGNIGQDPTLDTLENFWSKTPSYGDGAEILNGGLVVSNAGPRSANTWDSSDVTLTNDNALISLQHTDGTKNWLLGNIAGSLAVVDIDTATSPDGRAIGLSESTTYKLFHQGNYPDISEVTNGVEEAPQNGKLYSRRDASWVVVTTTSVGENPPIAAVGAGAGWYNLEDGQLYVDIFDGDSSQWVPSNPPVIPDIEYRDFFDTNKTFAGLGAGLTNQGDYATAIGNLAGNDGQNLGAVAVGSEAGKANQGENTVAIGRTAGQTNQGLKAVAVGVQAGGTDQGGYAVAFGAASGLTQQGGSSVAVGVNSGRTDQGINAVAVGNLAGFENQGDYALALGRDAGKTNQPANSICLNSDGNSSSPSSTKSIQIGRSDYTVKIGDGNVQSVSDARDKYSVIDSPLGLDFINALAPKFYKYDIRELYETDEDVVDENGEVVGSKLTKNTPDGSKAGNRYHSGFIAQEVKQTMDDFGVDFGLFRDEAIGAEEAHKDAAAGKLSLCYQEMIAIQAKAIQELSQKVDALEAIANKD